MREIKFRAYNKECKKMGDADTIQDWLRDFESHGHSHGSVGMPNNYKTKDYNFLIFLEYPGLKDKNGEEICEGDILQFKYFDESLDVGKLSYQDGQWVIEGVCKTWDNQSPFCINLCGNQDIVKIIGNIYDDPSLLEGD